MILRAITFVVCVSLILSCQSQAIERIDLSQIRASFVGEIEYDFCGASSCLAGDVDGDGYDDMLIFNKGSNRTYFIRGKLQGWKRHMNLYEADGSFICEHDFLFLSGAGDVNGDGYDDIIISEPRNNDEGTNSGKTFLFFGRSGGFGVETHLSEADVCFTGEQEEWAGFSVSGAGDVNGDGYDDILIGAFPSGGIVEHVGRAYLIFGKATGWATHTPLSDADASFVGPPSEDWSGSWITGVGDVNGDGYDDFLIAAHWRGKEWSDNTARVYLIFGHSSGWRKDVPMSESNITFISHGWFDYENAIYPLLGWMVARAGDVNGDGFDDILIGASWDDEGGAEAGQTYLVFGRPGGGESFEIGLSEAANASFIGEFSGDRSGGGLSGGGDFNGDGYDDILIGSYLNDGGGNDSGQTYLIFGKPNGWAKDRSLSEADVSFVGEEAEDYSGWPVSIAGDVNGDGYDDILIGASGNDYGATNAGQTYLQCRQERKGDVNFDGQMDAADVILAVNILIRLADSPPAQIWAADYDGDGTINVLDIVQVINIILGD